MTEKNLFDFIVESNRIERLYHQPTVAEMNEMARFMTLKVITIEELERFVKVYQPNAKLRDEFGLDVRVGNYYPTRGRPELRDDLTNLLNQDLSAYDLHIAYEKLHPFTDCNGRSGRALWASKYRDITNGFLMPFYFQTLKGAK